MDVKAKAIEAIKDSEKELESFRKQFNVDIQRFECAVKFCEEILDGTPKSKAYAECFDVPLAKARTLSSQFHRTKWVQELILFLRPDEQSLYFGERKRIIQAGMNIIDDPRASHRDKTEAMKALQPYIKQEKAEQEMNIKIETQGQTISETINNQIAEIASRGKMINDDGEIVDITVIE